MLRALIVVAASLVATVALGTFVDEDLEIRSRGDVNSDGDVDGSDAAYLNAYLFNGGAAPPCLNQADVNDDNQLDIADSSYLFAWLYQGGPEPPAPGPFATECTRDLTYLGCAQSPCE